MAIYHLHFKVIGRKSGSSAVASAAYRSASRLRDERLDRSHDFSAKRGVVHSEVMLPENVPKAWSDRERLWNDVEAFEVRKDAQLAREVDCGAIFPPCSSSNRTWAPNGSLICGKSRILSTNLPNFIQLRQNDRELFARTAHSVTRSANRFAI
jgi:hypothetical protein